MTAFWIALGFAVPIGIVCVISLVGDFRALRTLNAAQRKRADSAENRRAWEEGYVMGLGVGRLSKPIAAHVTYIVDLPTFHRIKEHEFLTDQTPITVPDSLSRDARGGTDGR